MSRWRNLLDALMSPAALFRMPKRAYLWFFLYLFCCAVMFTLAAVAIVSFSGDAESALVKYVFPSDWHVLAEWLIERYASDFRRVILVNAAIGGGLMFVTITLFPVKEKLSATLEREGRLVDAPIKELPLWEQGWEELKLFSMFIALQLSLFWLAYFPYPALKLTAIILSHVLLAYTFAIDFISPVFQRHEGYYSQILKTLFRRPLTCFFFGAMFASPVVVVAYLLKSHPNWNPTFSIVLVAGVNMLMVAWAAVSGTWLGARMFELFTATKRSHVFARWFFATVIVGLLAANIYLMVVLGNALHHKTQLLKCDYDVDWSSATIDAPDPTTLGNVLAVASGGKVEITIDFDVTITNDTSTDVELERSRIELTHSGTRVGETRLTPVVAAAGTTSKQHLQIKQEVDPAFILKGGDLLNSELWEITLFIQVSEYWEFPVFLMHPDKKKKKKK